MKTKRYKLSKIPQFKSREEEAMYWESHSIADFMGELEPVKARFVKTLSEGLHIRLNSETLQKLREKAKRKGIGPTTLVRMWILERLQSPQHI